MLSVPDLSAILSPSHCGFMEWYSCQNCLQVIIKKIKEAKNEGSSYFTWIQEMILLAMMAIIPRSMSNWDSKDYFAATIYFKWVFCLDWVSQAHIVKYKYSWR